jgi:hypothetical protein
MLCKKPYFCFEHGTIREIPYENSVQGCLTALAYRKAKYSFITNIDCIESAKYLCGENFHYINHVYDECRKPQMHLVQQMREFWLKKLKVDFIIFHPTRQDWVKNGGGFADKANDELLNAFFELRKLKINVGLVCCEWGSDIVATKEFIGSNNCTEKVGWIEPMGVVRFEAMCQAADIVADQFKLGAIGGVAYKCMAVGGVLLTYLDLSLMKAVYSEAPPVINAKYSIDIVNSLSECFSKPSLMDEVGKKSKEWMSKYHSADTSVNYQIERFISSQKIC